MLHIIKYKGYGQTSTDSTSIILPSSTTTISTSLIGIFVLGVVSSLAASIIFHHMFKKQ